MSGWREELKAGEIRAHCSLRSELGMPTLRTGWPLCLGPGRGKNYLVTGFFAFLIFSLNFNICLLVFIICATRGFLSLYLELSPKSYCRVACLSMALLTLINLLLKGTPKLLANLRSHSY